ncbi:MULTISPECIES: Rieske 2Fe-2S domain-containing protein [unclassified Spirosoma]|uniref:Rieske 2Fe-2S domain-containing protein n=1 Tax=unclassified Spirosoma TaxID=2621999 RepID=UPI0009596C1E|nr:MULTISPECIES: Rieske 2Fe-2S domain-containing protein [unclassified Spirosoma]MBN8821517.1 Rieske 2Fe-2S domain-containing protein [Spirosoma sp.]OJW78295.1 MAG: (2Fe-2S)-binding protein [Spirosoma sp. 48-14]
MTRLEFLKSMGFTGSALMALLTSCVHEEDTVVNALSLSGTTTTTPSTTTTATSSSTATSSTTTSGTTTNGTDLSSIKNRLLTIDLTSSAASALKTVGGYITQSGIVVAQSTAGVYVAATQTCSHEPKKAIMFNKTEYYCTQHGARFDLTGQGKNSFGSRGLTVYKTATDGKTLVVYS